MWCLELRTFLFPFDHYSFLSMLKWLIQLYLIASLPFKNFPKEINVILHSRALVLNVLPSLFSIFPLKNVPYKGAVLGLSFSPCLRNKPNQPEQRKKETNKKPQRNDNKDKQSQKKPTLPLHFVVLLCKWWLLCLFCGIFENMFVLIRFSW